MNAPAPTRTRPANAAVGQMCTASPISTFVIDAAPGVEDNGIGDFSSVVHDRAGRDHDVRPIFALGLDARARVDRGDQFHPIFPVESLAYSRECGFHRSRQSRL